MDRDELPERFTLRYIPPTPVKGQSAKYNCAAHAIACARGQGTIRDDSSYYIRDENPSQAGGSVAMDSNGSLSLNINGEIFKRVLREKEKMVPVFSFQSSTYPNLFLALGSDYNVKGMSERSMKDIRDCYWSYVLFEDIGGCSPRGSGYIALQYWGNRFHSPASHPYYFVIEMGEDNVPSFKIGPNEIALQYGRLAVQAANL